MYAFLFAKDLHDGTEVRRVGPGGDGHPDDGGQVADMALEGGRVLFPFLDVRRVAEGFAEALHLIEPLRLIVVLVENANVRFEDGRGVCRGHVLGKLVEVLLIKVVIEVGDEVRDLGPFGDIFSRLLSATVDAEDPERLVLVSGQKIVKVFVVFLRPGEHPVEDRFRAHDGDDVLRNVVEFRKVEQRAGHAHLLEIEREVREWCFLVGAAPVFEVRVGERQQVLEDRLFRVALFHIVADRRLRVLPLGKLALVAVIEFHDGGDVRVLRSTEPAVLEQLQVDRHGGDPLIAADHVGRAHEVVVHTVGEVVGRDAVGLQKDDVHDVLRQFHLAFDDVLVADLLFGVALGLET